MNAPDISESDVTAPQIPEESGTGRAPVGDQAERERRAHLPLTSVPLTPRRAKLALEVARLVMAGLLQAEIAERLDVSATVVRRLMRHPDFPRAVERARAALRTESEHAAEVGRAEALEAARDVLALAKKDPRAVSPADRLRAVQSILGASAPPSETQRAQARKELLAALPTSLRTQVLAALSGSESSFLAGLSDDELARLAEAD